MMVLSKRNWKKYLFVLITLTLILVATACSTGALIPTTSSPAVTTTQPVIPLTTSQGTQQIIQGTPTPALSITTPSNSPTPTSPPPPSTSPVYTATAASFTPSGTQLELFQYMLGLINKDRQDAGISPVILNYNAAAQIHAQDMLDNNYQAAHWGTDGKKPYMRYTDAGGINYEQENSCYYSCSEPINLKQQLKNFQSTMMAEVAPNDSHRVTMLNKWHKKVNLGIAYSVNTLTLVQQFEGDYVEYSKPPTIDGNTITLTGRFPQSGFKLNNISIAYDDLPQPISPSQLTSGMQYHHYGLGQRLGLIFPPPPAGQIYQNLPASSIVAHKGSFDYNGWFYIEADISQILSKGPGVYTVVLVALAGNEPVNMTNYSLFVK